VLTQLRLSIRSMLASVLSICSGACLGALARWMLAGRFNQVFPDLPLGTLAANLIGGYLIGIAVAVFAHMPELSPQARLFVVTGFLGALTTFSTFSAEVVTQLQQGHTLWALATALAHLLGSFALTALGIGTVAWLRS
jgi:fluoride exporter